MLGKPALYHLYLIGVIVLLLVQAVLAVRLGIGLAGKALVLILAYWLGSGVIGYPFFELAPRGTVERIIITWTIGVCVEDAARTWFVSKRARQDVPIVTAAIAFAVVVSIVETIRQSWDFVYLSYDYVFRGIENFEENDVMFFSGYAETFADLGIFFLKPVGHFVICILLYNYWFFRNLFGYAAIVIAHLCFDLFAMLLPVDDFPYIQTMLVIDLVFTGTLCLIAWRTRESWKGIGQHKEDGS